MMKFIFMMLVLTMESNVNAQQKFIGELTGEKQIEVANNGTVYVFNLSTSVLSRYTSKGELKYSVGGIGFNDDRFDRPRSFHLSAGLNLLVCDTGNKRVVIYDRNLQKIGEINEESSTKLQNWSPEFVLMNNVGQIWVVDALDQRLIQFDENGYLRFEVFLPEEINVTSIQNFIASENFLWLIDEKTSLAYRFSNLGKYQLFVALPKNLNHVKSVNRMIMGIQDSALVQISEKGLVMSHAKGLKLQTDKKEIIDWSLLSQSLLISTPKSIVKYSLD